MEAKFISVQQCADMFVKKDGTTGVNAAYIYYLLGKNKIKHTKVGKIFLIEESDFKAFNSNKPQNH